MTGSIKKKFIFNCLIFYRLNTKRNDPNFLSPIFVAFFYIFFFPLIFNFPDIYYCFAVSNVYENISYVRKRNHLLTMKMARCYASSLTKKQKEKSDSTKTRSRKSLSVLISALLSVKYLFHFNDILAFKSCFFSIVYFFLNFFLFLRANVQLY